MNFKRILCIFGIHEYKPISVYHYYDISWGGRFPSTSVTYQCANCGKIKVKSFYGSGFLELEDLQG